MNQSIITVARGPQTYQEQIDDFVGQQISGRLKNKMMDLRTCILKDAECMGIEVNLSEEYSRMITEIDFYLSQIPDHL